MRAYARRWAVIGLVLLAVAAAQAQQSPVAATVSGIAERLRNTLSEDQLLALDVPAVEKVLTPEEREVLATQYWSFDVNVPVVVSVMRDVKQATVPYWLPERGFTRTDLRVRNEANEYEVWQKPFDAGRVGLGINGFDKNRPHYFVCVGPQDPAAKLELGNFSPTPQVVLEMKEGSTVYHDWSELVLTEVPDSLRGQVLLPTIRGRAREAHLAGAFRKTSHPSSERPDQLLLTWSDDPRTTQTIQWRTAAAVDSGVVQYREKGTDAWQEAPAEGIALEDLLIVNDARVKRFSSTLRSLKPATTYEYTVGAPGGARSELAAFTTAPDGPAAFTFLVLSDTHNRPETEALLADAMQRYPQAAFCTITGDLVNTGQYRDDWDRFFAHTAAFTRGHALVPTLGNHDTVDGLGADLYRALFGLPENGSGAVPKEQSYSFRYGNALFVALDSMDSSEAQAPWLEDQLKGSDATWKFAMFHFPPFSPDDDYPLIRRDWCSLFDLYGMDFVMGGHVHDYLRTKNLRGGKAVEPQQGTVYLISVAVGGRERKAVKPVYAEVYEKSGKPVYLAVTVDGNRATVKAHDTEGNARDEYTEEKPE